jgi:hypothetical protein
MNQVEKTTTLLQPQRKHWVYDMKSMYCVKQKKFYVNIESVSVVDNVFKQNTWKVYGYHNRIKVALAPEKNVKVGGYHTNFKDLQDAEDYWKKYCLTKNLMYGGVEIIRVYNDVSHNKHCNSCLKTQNDDGSGHVYYACIIFCDNYHLNLKKFILNKFGVDRIRMDFFYDDVDIIKKFQMDTDISMYNMLDILEDVANDLCKSDIFEWDEFNKLIKRGVLITKNFLQRMVVSGLNQWVHAFIRSNTVIMHLKLGNVSFRKRYLDVPDFGIEKYLRMYSMERSEVLNEETTPIESIILIPLSDRKKQNVLQYTTLGKNENLNYLKSVFEINDGYDNVNSLIDSYNISIVSCVSEHDIFSKVEKRLCKIKDIVCFLQPICIYPISYMKQYIGDITHESYLDARNNWYFSSVDYYVNRIKACGTISVLENSSYTVDKLKSKCTFNINSDISCAYTCKSSISLNTKKKSLPILFNLQRASGILHHVNELKWMSPTREFTYMLIQSLWKTNFVLRKTHQNFVGDDNVCDDDDDGGDGGDDGGGKVHGGLISKAKTGVILKDIFVLDVTSAYPSVIMETNLDINSVTVNSSCVCLSKKRKSIRYDEEGDDDDDVSKEINQSTVELDLFYGLFGENKNLSRTLNSYSENHVFDIISNFVHSRAHLVESIKRGVSLKMETSTVTRLQKHLKLMSNIIYGLYGNIYSPIYCIGIANFISAYIRNVIRTLRNDIDSFVVSELDDESGLINDIVFETVYSHTDSVMFGCVNGNHDHASRLKDFIFDTFNRKYNHLKIKYEGMFKYVVFFNNTEYYGMLENGTIVHKGTFLSCKDTDYNLKRIMVEFLKYFFGVFEKKAYFELHGVDGAKTLFTEFISHTNVSSKELDMPCLTMKFKNPKAFLDVDIMTGNKLSIDTVGTIREVLILEISNFIAKIIKSIQ